MARKSMGRQKIEMVKMKNDGNLQVTFSKRRTGLFKKASELCTLCGAEIAVIVFSPGGKAFSFGHPDVGVMADRFITRNTPPTSGTMQLIEAHRNATVRELNMQLTQVQSQLEAARKRGEELNRMRKASQRQCWWQAPVEQLSKPQLEELKSALEELKINVRKEADKVILMETTNSQSSQQLFMGSSSGSNEAQPGPVLPYDPIPNMLPLPHNAFGSAFFF